MTDFKVIKGLPVDTWKKFKKKEEEVTEQEINKTIAEFMNEPSEEAVIGMGFEALGTVPTYRYTRSLDVCIPVVEKLGDIEPFIGIKFLRDIDDKWGVSFIHSDHISSTAKTTPALALSTALAKAIKEIN